MIEPRLRELLLDREKERRPPYLIKDLAASTGLAENTISNFRRGRTSRYDADVLNQLCRVLGVQVGDLLVYVPDSDDDAAE